MKTMARTGIPYADYAFNPAPGCTKGCDGCWARATAKRNQWCQQCRDFVPHLHPERLEQPANTKKPGVVAVNFMGDLFGLQSRATWIAKVFEAARAAPQHTYVFLTQNPKAMIEAMRDIWIIDVQNWYFGITSKDGDHMWSNWHDHWRVRGPLWLSLEPLRGLINLRSGPPACGVVVGCDRRASVPCDIRWVRNVVEQCRDRKTQVYVKQLNINGKVTANIEDFPEDLRIRELPWGDKLQERTAT